LKEEKIMDRKQFDSLDESLKENLKNCKSEAEKQKAIADNGMRELSPDMLEAVSGGTQSIPPEWFMKDE
jgi:hypothetical protein